MEYDLEMVMPVSSKYRWRLEDFKKYGAVNLGERKVIVSLILSGEKINGLEEGWPKNISVRAIHNEEKEYASNVYKYFMEMIPESRWIMKLDDDSCTDVDGLLTNLDNYYDSDEKFYLATSAIRFVYGSEYELASLYLKFFGDIFLSFQHELECSILSHAGLRHIKNNERAMAFLEERCSLSGGATDVALAFAASLSKLWPIDLPFCSHSPLINKFSSFGGNLNHIHLVSRKPEGDNFCDWERCGEVQYEALTRSIDGIMSEAEKSLAGKRFIMETDEELRLYDFRPNRTLRIKFDDKNYVWLEYNDSIAIFSDPTELAMSLKIDSSGNLVGKDTRDRDLVLKPLNF